MYIRQLLEVAKEKSNVLRTFRLRGTQVAKLRSDVQYLIECFENVRAVVCALRGVLQPTSPVLLRQVVAPELVNKAMAALFLIRDLFTESEVENNLVGIFKERVRYVDVEDGQIKTTNHPHAYHVSSTLLWVGGSPSHVLVIYRCPAADVHRLYDCDQHATRPDSQPAARFGIPSVVHLAGVRWPPVRVCTCHRSLGGAAS